MHTDLCNILYFLIYYILRRRNYMGKEKLRRRSEIAEQYKWNMKDMYASDELWEKEVQLVFDMTKEVETYKGRLAENASNLLSCLKKMDEISYYGMRVYVYANQRYHEDTGVAKYQGYSAKADSVRVAVSSATSYVKPEVLAIGEAVIERFFKEEPELEHYRRSLNEI